MSIYDFNAINIQGDEVSLADYQNKVVLIVNTASKCGYTPQLEGLETLYNELNDERFVVLGFPCNQFGGQEPEDEKKIKIFCDLNFNISFDLFKKLEVNGAGAHP